MAQVQVESEATTNKTVKFLLSFLLGPVVFFIVQAIPIADLKPAGHFALSTFAWILAWWVVQPIPWAVTGLLPLVLLPLGNAMPLADVTALYGQRILFFLIGVMLFGHAFEKHGLARRFAMKILSVPGVATSGNRLVLMVMIVSTIISAFVDDAATVAMMIPIAMSIAKFATDRYAKAAPGQTATAPRMLEATALAVLYGSAAGGMMTPAGVPFNPLSISILEQLTSYKIDFAQWTLTGIILGGVSIPFYYFILRFMSPPEIGSISDGAEFFRREQQSLGPMTRGEKNVLFVLLIMIVLWFLPVFVAIRALDIWIVPPIAAMLLFLLPINSKTGEMTLTSKDFQSGVAWNVTFLVVSGAAIAVGLTRLGATEWFGDIVKSRVTVGVLPWFGGFMTNIIAHFTSGGVAATTMVSTILFPIAHELGFNPAVMARIVPGSALAISFPWAGAAAATAFASGAISFRGMLRIGIVATIIVTVVTIALSMIVVPALGGYAYTAP